MAHAIVVKHSTHSSCFHMRFNINKKKSRFQHLSSVENTASQPMSPNPNVALPVRISVGAGVFLALEKGTTPPTEL